MSYRVLVVSSDETALDGALQVLNRAGFDAKGAETFQAASRAMSVETPDLLIADERLGAFNGLHLVVRGRAASPRMRAIVTSNAIDTVLESDAKQLNALCFARPADPREWLGRVWRTLEAPVLLSA
jgi:DNA-binding NtrC family response regulator